MNVGHANHNNYGNVAIMGALGMETSLFTVLVLNILAKAQAIYCALHAVRIFTSSFCTKFVGHCHKIVDTARNASTFASHTQEKRMTLKSACKS